ncbi:MAG TPA: helix-turn-helix domain-containing protein [Gaiellaceae bacterium]|nr:helix-turn-helix domain-containing protein [Gaiellaceae bacterium]
MSSVPFVGVSERLARSVRAQRQARGFSLGELARRSGVSKASLSNLEAGGGNPSLETLWRIAGALSVPLGELLGEDEPPATLLIPAGVGAPVASDSGLSGRMLLAEGRVHRTELLEATLEPGADYRARGHAVGTEEVVFCCDGSLLVGPVGDEYTLGERDSLRFPADVAHRYASESGATVLVVMSYPVTAGPGGGT